jgi:hypothetical protein
VFCEEPSYAGLPWKDVGSLVGVVLKAFDSRRKCGITPIAVYVISLLLCPCQPASATRANAAAVTTPRLALLS